MANNPPLGGNIRRINYWREFEPLSEYIAHRDRLGLLAFESLDDGLDDDLAPFPRAREQQLDYINFRTSESPFYNPMGRGRRNFQGGRDLFRGPPEQNTLEATSGGIEMHPGPQGQRRFRTYHVSRLPKLNEDELRVLGADRRRGGTTSTLEELEARRRLGGPTGPDGYLPTAPGGLPDPVFGAHMPMTAYGEFMTSDGAAPRYASDDPERGLSRVLTDTPYGDTNLKRAATGRPLLGNAFMAEY